MRALFPPALSCSMAPQAFLKAGPCHGPGSNLHWAELWLVTHAARSHGGACLAARAARALQGGEIGSTGCQDDCRQRAELVESRGYRWLTLLIQRNTKAAYRCKWRMTKGSKQTGVDVNGQYCVWCSLYWSYINVSCLRHSESLQPVFLVQHLLTLRTAHNFPTMGLK